MRNASERKDIRRAEKLARQNELARVEFIVGAMATKQGRAWFHNLLSSCGIFDGSFSGDALFEAFAKGQRNIGLQIYNDVVSHCSDNFVLMMREAQIQEVLNDRRSELDPDDRTADDEYSGGED